MLRTEQMQPCQLCSVVTDEAVQHSGMAANEEGMPVSAVLGHEDGSAPSLIGLMVASAFGLSRGELEQLMEPQRYIGRCPQQVRQFLDACAPLLRQAQGADGDIRV